MSTLEKTNTPLRRDEGKSESLRDSSNPCAKVASEYLRQRRCLSHRGCVSPGEKYLGLARKE